MLGLITQKKFSFFMIQILIFVHLSYKIGACFYKQLDYWLSSLKQPYFFLLRSSDYWSCSKKFWFLLNFIYSGTPLSISIFWTVITNIYSHIELESELVWVQSQFS